jgi:hypothetical protein
LKELALPSVGASFKKWGTVHPTPQEAHALATCKGIKKIIKKGMQKNYKKNSVAHARPLPRLLLETSNIHNF